ncbi:hypothetical protein DCAR_0625727 [Daucus carota subsp. sativus]|uniref:PORR domain-containing protein n=1 Tax=Daucus carota subsp. sativus TaxID=79200 RepID=A0AAF0XFV9_DAUCS|nr:PREDICTED: protein ROOT PRIMORDIUM DEFECTIVE 1 [Daucus carota subsp. sativus]WOH06302.1 hypothetical protein DCAR_0625727 [Daucus carota subsp. sativus]
MTRVLQTFTKHKLNPPCSISFGPFNSSTQFRWKKKPTSTARTRLETRTRDLKLDQLSARFKKLNLILHLHKLMIDKKRGPFVSLQLMSRWNNIIGLNIGIGAFLRKYPHVFDVFTHPVKRNVCCRITEKMKGLLNEEEDVVRDLELENVKRVKKILLMSVNGRIHVHALRLVRRELGLPEDFRDSVLGKYSEDFRLVDLEVVELVDRDDESLRVAKIEEWREREYREKWLSEYETKYAFPIDFPTGFKIGAGFKEKLKNWQRMNYVKPYDVNEVVRVRTCGGIERFEKRAVAILHELLSLTVEKMIEVERIVHFRKDLGIEVNLRELILKHPGIFYISTKGSNQLVFLREAYSSGCLIETNPIHDVRRKMLELMLMGCRNTKELKIEKEKIKDRTANQVLYNDGERGGRDTDFVISILENCHGHNYDYGASDIEDSSE